MKNKLRILMEREEYSQFYIQPYVNRVNSLAICSPIIHEYFEFPYNIPFDLIISNKPLPDSYEIVIIYNESILVHTKLRVKEEFICRLCTIKRKFELYLNRSYYIAIEY